MRWRIIMPRRPIMRLRIIIRFRIIMRLRIIMREPRIMRGRIIRDRIPMREPRIMRERPIIMPPEPMRLPAIMRVVPWLPLEAPAADGAFLSIAAPVPFMPAPCALATPNDINSAMPAAAMADPMLFMFFAF